MATLSDRFNINAQLEHLQVSLGFLLVHCRLVRRRVATTCTAECFECVFKKGKNNVTADGRLQIVQSSLLCCPHPRLQSKYVGTGHPDINRFEWNLNIKRDTYASFIGHHSLTAYHAIAENESMGRIKYNFLQVRFG